MMITKGHPDFPGGGGGGHLINIYVDMSSCRLPTAQGKQGKWHKKNSLSGKTQGIWKFCQNTRNLVCSSCKFPDSKGKRYFEICCKNIKKIERKRS